MTPALAAAGKTSVCDSISGAEPRARANRSIAPSRFYSKTWRHGRNVDSQAGLRQPARAVSIVVMRGCGMSELMSQLRQQCAHRLRVHRKGKLWPSVDRELTVQTL